MVVVMTLSCHFIPTRKLHAVPLLRSEPMGRGRASRLTIPLYVPTACLAILPISGSREDLASMMASTDIEHGCHRFAEHVTTAKGEPQAQNLS